MNDKIYLPGLNGIRTIAAITVVFSHIGLNLEKFGLEKMKALSAADFGVTIFFTLSGFLITYLLLCEKQLTNTIDIKKFYIRRVLRIWPLYFFYLLIILMIVPFVVNKELFFYIFMAGNIPYAMNVLSRGDIFTHIICHYWSLGVEEQFYAFWPWLIRFFKKTKIFLIIFITAFFLLKIYFNLTHSSTFIQNFLHITRFGCMGIGAIGAYLFHKKKEKIIIFNKIYFELFAWFMILLVACNKFHIFNIIDHEIISIVTLIIIFNQINNQKKIISLENKFFDFLGKISFGLYVYNPLIIYLVGLLFGYFTIENQILKIVMIYVVTITLIIFISHISYSYLEKPFLKLKFNYMTIKSAASKNESEN